MIFFKTVKTAVLKGVNSLYGGIQLFFRRPKKSSSPLADRLLADALLFGEIPSPTEREEDRAVFVVERLKSLSIPHAIDGAGNIFVRLHGKEGYSAEPLLLFTGLGSDRWNSLGSLGHLDTQFARGAGLADALGPAALLSVAESHHSGYSLWKRDILLLFSVFGFDDPSTDAFLPFAEPRYRPFAAIGIRGFPLGAIFYPALGSYRVEIKLETEAGRKKSSGGGRGGRKAEKNGAVSESLTGTLVNMAAGYLAKAGTEPPSGGNGGVSVNIRRIEAQAVYGYTPQEGILELGLESSGREALDGALEKIRADTEQYNHDGLVSSLRVMSNTPPADPARCAGLGAVLKRAMKDLKVKPAENFGADPSSFLTNMGIPALSLGLSGGTAGLDHDTVEISTVETGRLLLERCIDLVTGEENW
ncbi:MAG: hypothetical protein LBI67_12575 [Treponema sp.]|jgi:acetylornithine deacetylase/succinyl-diaminopimelate desuccinylase-like protein|nr:hypothetical protein [Treponema sp.]